MSFIPPKITPARQPGCQRHARGTLWQYQERQQSHTTRDWARGDNGHGTIVTSKRKVRGKQHCAPAGPTHTACSHKVMMTWASTTSL
eukprot:scaffold93565_cov73-Phaeocystis_antarctica.AAC.1